MFLVGISVAGRTGGRVLPRRRHMDTVGMRIVPRGFLKRGDRLAVANPCRTTDKALREELSDTGRGWPVQSLATSVSAVRRNVRS